MNTLGELLSSYTGHNVEITQYGNGVNFALEDMDTNSVIIDTDTYDLIANAELDEPTLECEEQISSSYVTDTVLIHRYGVNDYSVTYKNGDCSTRGTLMDILQDMDEYFCWVN